MAKSFKVLRAKMSPATQQRAEEKTRLMLEAMPLQELRQARALSQDEMAKSLGIKQAAVSKLERRTDMYLSTLRKFVAYSSEVGHAIQSKPAGHSTGSRPPVPLIPATLFGA